VEVTAYATRFGQHLRSVVLDAAVGTPALKAFARDGDSARVSLREVRLDCLRSPTCSADHPNPDADFERLTHAVRSQSVTGQAYDANGNLKRVRLDAGSGHAWLGTQERDVTTADSWLTAIFDELLRGRSQSVGEIL
jgi:hypothetical protein